MRMLRETDEDVTGISIDVGFRSLGTFSRTFREIVGVSPVRVPRARASRSEGSDPSRSAGLLRGEVGPPAHLSDARVRPRVTT